MLLIAFFGVIFAVNGYFLYSALSTHTGVVAIEPYRKGLAYNERIAADERQKALGWQRQTSLARDGRVSRRCRRCGKRRRRGLTIVGDARPAVHDRGSTTR